VRRLAERVSHATVDLTPPRSTPASVFNDLASIGERMREIQAEEDRRQLNTALMKPADPRVRVPF
jgi:hypothetical protein